MPRLPAVLGLGSQTPKTVRRNAKSKNSFDLTCRFWYKSRLFLVGQCTFAWTKLNGSRKIAFIQHQTELIIY